MIRRPPDITHSTPPCPYTPLCRSDLGDSAALIGRRALFHECARAFCAVLAAEDRLRQFPFAFQRLMLRQAEAFVDRAANGLDRDRAVAGDLAGNEIGRAHV